MRGPPAYNGLYVTLLWSRRSIFMHREIFTRSRHFFKIFFPGLYFSVPVEPHASRRHKGCLVSVLSSATSTLRVPTQCGSGYYNRQVERVFLQPSCGLSNILNGKFFASPTENFALLNLITFLSTVCRVNQQTSRITIITMGSVLSSSSSGADAAAKDAHQLTASAAMAKIRAGEMTMEAYAKALLERIEKRDNAVHAWAYLNPEYVLEQARTLDKVPEAERGPLHGMAIGVKDVIYTKGE